MYELKITVRLEEDSDIKFWNTPIYQQQLAGALSHKFDIPKEKIHITMKEDTWNGPEFLKFVEEYAKELEENCPNRESCEQSAIENYEPMRDESRD